MSNISKTTLALSAVFVLCASLVVVSSVQAGEKHSSTPSKTEYNHSENNTESESDSESNAFSISSVVNENNISIETKNENENDNSTEVKVKTGDVNVTTGNVIVKTAPEAPRHPAIAGATTAVPVPITAQTGAGAVGLVSTLLGGAGLVRVAKKEW